MVVVLIFDQLIDEKKLLGDDDDGDDGHDFIEKQPSMVSPVLSIREDDSLEIIPLFIISIFKP